MRRVLVALSVLSLLACVLGGCGGDGGGTVGGVTTEPRGAGATTTRAGTTTSAAVSATTAPDPPTTSTSITTSTTTSTTTTVPPETGGVGIGADGWLFHPDSWVPMCGNVDVTAAAARMRRLSDAFAAAGKRVALVIAPDKGGVYADHLGPLETSFDCAEERRAELRAALAADPPAGFIDVWAATAGLRATTDELLYPPHDSHWTTFTAVRIAELIVNEFQEGAWDESCVRFAGTHSRGGDLANMMDVPRTEVVKKYEVDRQGVTVSSLESGTRAIHEYATEATGDADILPGRVLVIHDSYGNWFKEPLANHIEEAWFVHWRLLKLDVISFDQLVEIAADSDYVVIEIAERLCYERFLDDFPEMHELMEQGL
jgi:hypothetical protein